MPSDYQLTPQEYKGLKSKLTRAINSGNQDKIIQTVEAALARFEQVGFPDDWSRWERAKQDAEFAKQRQGAWGGPRAGLGL